MKTLSVNRKHVISILVPFLVIFFGIQATSYAQGKNPTITASTRQPLTEEILDGSIVTLTLSNGIYRNLDAPIASALTVSGIDGVTVDDSLAGVDRISDTKVEIKLEFNGNIDTDATLTFTLGANGIENYEGPALTAKISVIAVSESLTASSIVPLTERTLNTSIVTLTLSGRVSYHTSEKRIKDALKISGIAGVTIPGFNGFGDLSIDVSSPSSILDETSVLDPRVYYLEAI